MMSKHFVSLFLFAWLVVVQCAPLFQPLDLNVINRPFVISHNLSDGTIVDCVKIKDQITFQDPCFKRHVIEEPPPLPSKMDSMSQGGNGLVQLFHVEGRSCPTRTIPIQRATKASLEESAKFHGYKRSINQRNATARGEKVVSYHYYAMAILKEETYNGVASRISLWKPQVNDDTALSISQIWAASLDNSNTVEVGWQSTINIASRLFIYWTGDKDTGNTGCYNLECTGFIQTDATYVLGGSIAGVDGSSALYVIYKGLGNGNWWLRIEDSYVGYWPNTLFTAGFLKDGLAFRLGWGGEVFTFNTMPHVQMGNGKFGSTGNQPVKGETNVPTHHALLTYLLPPKPPATDLNSYEADKAVPSQTTPNYYNTNKITHVKGEPGLAGGTWLFFGGPGAV